LTSVINELHNGIVWLWRRVQVTANFYEALLSYEVVGLVGVERILRLPGSKPSYTKICYSITPFSPVVSLQSSTQKTLG